MSISSTNMSTLLTNLKTLILEYQTTTLSKINTFQRGCLSPVCVFPSLAILPISENYIYGFSNGKYEVERSILMECYDIKLSTKQSKDNSIDLIKAIKNILEDNFTIKDSCYTSKWSNENYGETIDVSKGFLNMSSITLLCKTRETYQTTTVTNTTTNNPSIVTLQDKILSILKTNKVAKYSTVKNIVDSPISPIPEFPAILLGAGTLSRKEYPNANVSDVSFNIGIATQLFHKETSLNHNLSIVEGVKDVLQQDHTFDGLCDFSNIRSVYYAQERIPSGFLYSTSIDLVCRIREFI